MDSPKIIAISNQEKWRTFMLPFHSRGKVHHLAEELEGCAQLHVFLSNGWQYSLPL